MIPGEATGKTRAARAAPEVSMTIEAWLQAAVADAERRGLPALKPLLEALARATQALRAADFNEHANRSCEDLPSFHIGMGGFYPLLGGEQCHESVRRGYSRTPFGPCRAEDLYELRPGGPLRNGFENCAEPPPVR